MENTIELGGPIERMTKDIRNAAKVLTAREARYLVDTYYQMQDNRIRSGNQIRAMQETQEPSLTIEWFNGQAEGLEGRVKSALDAYSGANDVGKWMRRQKGIGPVIAAGFLANIDITRAQTAGAIWRFAGLDPTQKWEKGQKRPWNASLKRLCWILGESFVKVSGHEDAFYGNLYARRKEWELSNNEQFVYKEQADIGAARVGKTTEAYKHYKAGKLPPGHIHARAKRYAVKMFLSHLHEVWRKAEGLEIPRPFVIEHMGHVHYIAPPE